MPTEIEKCIDCGRELTSQTATAKSSRGTICLDCFRRGKGQGTPVTMLDLIERIDALERRVSRLEMRSPGEIPIGSAD